MSHIPIWPGSSSFFPGDTPFGFYDNDQSFQTDSEMVATWCASRLGYPLVDIELQAVNFFAAFEEATNEYGTQLYNFQIINNFGNVEGTTTGSNFNNQLITPNLGGVVNLSEQYGNETDGSGGDYKLESGSLIVSPNQQRYDLLTHIGSSVSGSEAIYIKRLYHNSPAAINRYFDPYAGTGTGIQSLMQTFGFGNYSPGVNFMLMPLSFDIQKLQAIELNDTIRKSGYHFELTNNRYLKLFPIPSSAYRLHYEYVVQSVANAPVKNPSTGLITDASNVPYTNPVYAYINEPGRQWIRKYALALIKEMLGSVRGKYTTIPVPGAETTLDHVRLITEAKEEKTKLIEEIQTLLGETTRLKQLERKNQESQQSMEIFYKVPYPIYVL